MAARLTLSIYLRFAELTARVGASLTLEPSGVPDRLDLLRHRPSGDEGLRSDSRQ